MSTDNEEQTTDVDDDIDLEYEIDGDEYDDESITETTEVNDSDDESELEIDDEIDDETDDIEDVEEIVTHIVQEKMQLLEKPRSSNIITMFEVSQILSIRTKQFEEGAPAYTDVEGIDTSSKRAVKEFLDRKCPLTLQRQIGKNYIEQWDVNTMIITTQQHKKLQSLL